jgi:hypothetical protein
MIHVTIKSNSIMGFRNTMVNVHKFSLEHLQCSSTVFENRMD